MSRSLASQLLWEKKSLNRVYTQIAGHAIPATSEDARKEFRLGGAFHFLALRYVQAQLVQQRNPLDVMRNIPSNSDSPAGCSSVRTGARRHVHDFP